MKERKRKKSIHLALPDELYEYFTKEDNVTETITRILKAYLETQSHTFKEKQEVEKKIAETDKIIEEYNTKKRILEVRKKELENEEKNAIENDDQSSWKCLSCKQENNGIKKCEFCNFPRPSRQTTKKHETIIIEST